MIKVRQNLMTLIFACSSLVSISCSNLLFYPKNYQILDPRKLGYSPEDVWLTINEQSNIHAWYFSAEDKVKSKGTIVYFHGNAENLSSHFISLVWITKFNYNVLIFDYPGYGRSDGSPSQENTVLAGQSAIRWAAKKDSRPLIIYGQSLGGIIATRCVLDLKNDIKFKTLILDSSFDSYKDVAASVLRKSWITWIF